MRKSYQFLCITALLLFGSACSDFLDVRPVGAVDEDALLNKEGIDKVITGMYAKLHNTSYFEATLSNYVYGDVMGGSANKGSNASDQPAFTSLELYAITTDNSYLNVKWRRSYDGVYGANTVIVMADKIKDKLSQIEGEAKDYYTETVADARFIRAFFHFEVIKLFGAAVPYVSDKDLAESVDPKISNVDESNNYIYIWDKVIDDLQYAYDNLPHTWSVQKGRANKWAAGALLAKVKMYQSSPYNGTNNTVNLWAEVKSLLETIMSNGVDNNGTKYRLAETYEELYVVATSDWTGESIFDIQMSISGTITNTNVINGSSHIGMVGALGVGGWGFYQPSNDLVNSHIVNDNGLPYLNKEYQNQPPLTVSVSGIPKTDLAVYTDPRLDISTGRFNVPYWDWAIPTTIDGWIREVTNGGYYLNKKNIPLKADKGTSSISTSASSTTKNFHLIRYADLMLWYAEALIETGEHQRAGEYINAVRARAANSYVKSADSETMENTSSAYVLENKTDGTKKENAAANYRIGLYSDSQFASKESATAALRFERKLELAMEGHRWYDLARWNIAVQELTNYIGYEKQYLSKYTDASYNAKWVCMPIPHTQILTMDELLVQNENWKSEENE